MEKTRKLFSQILKSEQSEYSVEKACLEYQQTQDPSLLALVFQKLYHLMLSEMKRANYIDHDDFVSIAVTSLDNAMLHYLPDKGKFTTLYVTTLRSGVNRQYAALSGRKRGFKEILFEPLEVCLISETGEDVESLIDDRLFREKVLSNKLLNKGEKRYAYSVMTNAERTTDLINRVGVSYSMVTSWKKGLRKKLGLGN